MKAIALVLTLGLGTAAHADRERRCAEPEQHLADERRGHRARVQCARAAPWRPAKVLPAVEREQRGDHRKPLALFHGRDDARAFFAQRLDRLRRIGGARQGGAVGALAMGATLDAASSDAARDQEAKRPIGPPALPNR